MLLEYLLLSLASRRRRVRLTTTALLLKLVKKALQHIVMNDQLITVNIFTN